MFPHQVARFFRGIVSTQAAPPKTRHDGEWDLRLSVMYHENFREIRAKKQTKTVCNPAFFLVPSLGASASKPPPRSVAAAFAVANQYTTLRPIRRQSESSRA